MVIEGSNAGGRIVTTDYVACVDERMKTCDNEKVFERVTFVVQARFEHVEQEVGSVEAGVDDAVEEEHLFGAALVVRVAEQLELLALAVHVVQDGERGVLLRRRFAGDERGINWVAGAHDSDHHRRQ